MGPNITEGVQRRHSIAVIPQSSSRDVSVLASHLRGVSSNGLQSLSPSIRGGNNDTSVCFSSNSANGKPLRDVNNSKYISAFTKQLIDNGKNIDSNKSFSLIMDQTCDRDLKSLVLDKGTNAALALFNALPVVKGEKDTTLIDKGYTFFKAMDKLSSDSKDANSYHKSKDKADQALKTFAIDIFGKINLTTQANLDTFCNEYLKQNVYPDIIDKLEQKGHLTPEIIQALRDNPAQIEEHLYLGQNNSNNNVINTLKQQFLERSKTGDKLIAMNSLIAALEHKTQLIARLEYNAPNGPASQPDSPPYAPQSDNATRQPSGDYVDGGHPAQSGMNPNITTYNITNNYGNTYNGDIKYGDVDNTDNSLIVIKNGAPLNETLKGVRSQPELVRPGGHSPFISTAPINLLDTVATVEPVRGKRLSAADVLNKATPQPVGSKLFDAAKGVADTLSSLVNEATQRPAGSKLFDAAKGVADTLSNLVNEATQRPVDSQLFSTAKEVTVQPKNATLLNATDAGLHSIEHGKDMFRAEPAKVITDTVDSAKLIHNHQQASMPLPYSLNSVRSPRQYAMESMFVASDKQNADVIEKATQPANLFTVEQGVASTLSHLVKQTEPLSVAPQVDAIGPGSYTSRLDVTLASGSPLSHPANTLGIPEFSPDTKPDNLTFKEKQDKVTQLITGHQTGRPADIAKSAVSTLALNSSGSALGASGTVSYLENDGNPSVTLTRGGQARDLNRKVAYRLNNKAHSSEHKTETTLTAAGTQYRQPKNDVSNLPPPQLHGKGDSVTLTERGATTRDLSKKQTYGALK